MNAENGFASEESGKEYQTDSSPGPSTGKQRRRKRRKNAKYSNQDFQDPELKVRCGNVKGVLYKNKLAEGISQKCIKDSHGEWLTPVEFEASGDRTRWKNWRRSITCKGFPLEKLIEEGDLPKPPREYHRKKRAYLVAESRLSLRSKPKRCSGSTLLNTPGTRVGRRRWMQRNLSTQTQHRKHSELPGKGPADTNGLCYFHSPTSPASSSTTSALTYDDNLGGVTHSLSPSSKVPATSQHKLSMAEMTATALSLPLGLQQQAPPVSTQRREENELLALAESEAVEEEEMPPLEGSEEDELLPQLRLKEELPVLAESEAAENEMSARAEELLLQSPEHKEDDRPPPESVEGLAPEVELGEVPPLQAAGAEEPQVKTTAMPMPGRRWQRHRRRPWRHTQCRCSALAPQVLARIRILHCDMLVGLGRNVEIQDRLLFLEGNARATRRILQMCQRTMAAQEQHSIHTEATTVQTLLEQLLVQNDIALANLQAIMERLGIAPFDV